MERETNIMFTQKVFLLGSHVFWIEGPPIIFVFQHSCYNYNFIHINAIYNYICADIRQSFGRLGRLAVSLLNGCQGILSDVKRRSATLSDYFRPSIPAFVCLPLFLLKSILSIITLWFLWNLLCHALIILNICSTDIRRKTKINKIKEINLIQ
jgi:hypothetical protein